MLLGTQFKTEIYVLFILSGNRYEQIVYRKVRLNLFMYFHIFLEFTHADVQYF